MAAKKVEAVRIDSWAAKRRAVGPTERVIIGEVRLLWVTIMSRCSGDGGCDDLPG